MLRSLAAASSVLLLLPILGGCVGEDGLLPTGRPGGVPAHIVPGRLAFTPAVELTSDGYGYEPSIEVGPDGTLYATAHKSSLTNEGTRLASWLWYSSDGGVTWSEMPSPAQAHDKLFAFEGDLAVDAEGRVYYVDTYLADNTISRWSPGPTWDYTRPVQGALAVDDRPWLAAHGDGIVYYMGNSGAALPALNNLMDEPGSASRIWIYTSTDGGLTWSPGHGFARSGWCGIEASRVDDETVFVGCSRSAPGAPLATGGASEMVAYTSTDRGTTWDEVVVRPLEGPMAGAFPSVGTDRGGIAYFAWGDDGDEDQATRLYVARSRGDGAWDVLDVTPFEGTFRRVWIAGGDAGTAALVFYGTTDVDPDEGSEWRAYAMVTRSADRERPVWDLAPVDAETVVVGPSAPGDFFQVVVGPDNVVHIAYQRFVASDVQSGYQNEILYARNR